MGSLRAKTKTQSGARTMNKETPIEEVPYSLRVSFTTNRILTKSELDALENAIAAQVEDPHVPNEDGDYVRAEFTVRNAIVDVES